MLTVEKVMEIRRLLEEGQLSQRKIALKLGVSRGIVNSIAAGRRGLHGRETSEKYPFDNQDAQPQRCRGCGAMVYMPCLLCRARQYRMREEQDAVRHSSELGATKSRVA